MLLVIAFPGYLCCCSCLVGSFGSGPLGREVCSFLSLSRGKWAPGLGSTGRTHRGGVPQSFPSKGICAPGITPGSKLYLSSGGPIGVDADHFSSLQISQSRRPVDCGTYPGSATLRTSSGDGKDRKAGRCLQFGRYRGVIPLIAFGWGKG